MPYKIRHSPEVKIPATDALTN